MRSLVILLLVTGVGDSLQGQGSERNCRRDSVDSLYLVQVGAYRACDVDRPAAIRTDMPFDGLVDFAPEGNGCYRTELEFVVDTLGMPEWPTVRTRSTNSPALTDAMRARVPLLRYTPARLADRPVRQVVIYKRSIATRTVATRLGAPPPSLRSPLGC